MVVFNKQQKQPQQSNNQQNNAQPQQQSQNQQGNGQQQQKKQRPVLYPNTGSISIVLAPAKKGKYGYVVLVKPLYGTYYDGKQKRSYGVRDLQKQNIDAIYLKIKDNDLAQSLQRGLVLIWNPNDAKKLLIYNAEDDKNDNKQT